MANLIFHEISFDDYNNYRNAQEQEYMASFWDTTIKRGESEIAVKYVNAVATASRYRSF